VPDTTKLLWRGNLDKFELFADKNRNALEI